MIEVTQSAAEQIHRLLSEDGKQETHGLRMKVIGGGCSGLQYQLSFDDVVREIDTEVEKGRRARDRRREERALPGRLTAQLRRHAAGVGLQDREPERLEHLRLWPVLRGLTTRRTRAGKAQAPPAPRGFPTSTITRRRRSTSACSRRWRPGRRSTSGTRPARPTPTAGAPRRPSTTRASESLATLGAEPREIVFTSGATESNNLAILGLADARARPGHVVTLATEHPAVLDPLARSSDAAGA